jgi:hypothetical protein
MGPTIRFLLILLLCVVNLALLGVLYGTVYGSHGLLKRQNSSISTGGGGATTSLGTLTDVSLSGLTSGNSLIYSGLTSKWQNRSLVSATAQYSFLGDIAAPIPPTVSLDLTTPNQWYNIFQGGTATLTQNSAGNWDVNNFGVRWLRSSQEFNVNVTLSISAAGQADTYFAALFVNDTLVSGTVNALYFPGTSRNICFTMTKQITLNSMQTLDVRLIDVTNPTLVRTILMSNANLSLIASIPL